MDDNKTVSGTNMGHLFARLDLLAPQFHALLAMYDAGEIAPRVDKTFSVFADAAARSPLPPRPQGHGEGAAYAVSAGALERVQLVRARSIAMISSCERGVGPSSTTRSASQS